MQPPWTCLLCVCVTAAQVFDISDEVVFGGGCFCDLYFCPGVQIAHRSEVLALLGCRRSLGGSPGFLTAAQNEKNGLYLILQRLIRQTSPFLPVDPASPCRRKEWGGGGGEWRKTVRNLSSRIKD